PRHDPPGGRQPPGHLRREAALLLRRRPEAGPGAPPERPRVRRPLARRPAQREARAVGPALRHTRPLGRREGVAVASPVSSIETGTQTYFEVVDFLNREAELLDDNKIREWFGLL